MYVSVIKVHREEKQIL